MARVDNSGGLIPTGDDWGVEAQPLLLTKLHRPEGAPEHEMRVRLHERLVGHDHRALTLISAPAGYGKTTLASAWLGGQDGPTAWVSLDERDDDLVTFTSYLVAAARATFPAAVFKTDALLQAPVPPDAAAVARYLANDFELTGARLVLALDDIHVIRNPAVFDLLGELLRHPSPSLHLLLIGRRDPPLSIASLRARGQVTEIRARDLMFTPPETACFLGQMLHRDIPADVAAEWTQKTEGWVTALHLAALSLLQCSQTDEVRTGLLLNPQFIQEYLLEDVLARMPPAKRQWLLRASLLDRFSAPMCQTVCRSDADQESGLTGTEFVCWLRDDNLFLVTLDDQGQWFRLHHLFQSLLRQLLEQNVKPDEIAALRMRASAWCAANGLLDEAVEYALAAGDVAAAVQTLLQHRYDLMNAGQWRYLDRLLKRLPAGAAAQSPQLLCTEAFLAVQHNDPWTALAFAGQAGLLLASRTADSEVDQIARAELAMLQPIADTVRGQFARAIADTRTSLEHLLPNAHYVRAMALSHIGFALHASGQTEEAVRTFKETLAHASWPGGARTVLLNSSCSIQAMQGDLTGVMQTAAECVRYGGKAQLPELVSLGRYYLGMAHYLRNEWDEAKPYLRALLDNPFPVELEYLSFGVFALALIHQGENCQLEAGEVIDRLAAHLAHTDYTLTEPLIGLFRVELELRRGDLAQARRWGFSRLPENHVNFVHFYSLDLTPPRLLLAERTPASLAEARKQLEGLHAAMAALQIRSVSIDALAMLALVHDALDEEATALERLRTALELAGPGRCVRNFADLGPAMADLLVRLRRQPQTVRSAILPHLDHVLAAVPVQGASRPPATPLASAPHPTPLVESLTERELRVASLLATDLSPDDMARQLAISSTTVRTHIRNIYAKLSAHSRYEAVQRARELHIF